MHRRIGWIGNIVFTSKQNQMVPGLILKAVIPKVLDMILRQFSGIEKIDKLVKYMEDENETDTKVKELESRVVKLEQSLKIKGKKK